MQAQDTFFQVRPPAIFFATLPVAHTVLCTHTVSQTLCNVSVEYKAPVHYFEMNVPDSQIHGLPSTTEPSREPHAFQRQRLVSRCHAELALFRNPSALAQ